MKTHLPKQIGIALDIGVILLLCACGASSTNSGSDAVGVNTPTAPAVPTPTTVNFNGLHVSSDGIQCEPWIVLNDSHRINDIGFISQLKTYLSSAVKVPDGISAYIDLSSQLPVTPAGIDLVQGSIGNEFDGVYSNLMYSIEPQGHFGCAAAVTLTNTSHENIQLSKIGVRFLRDSEKNGFAYHLIDYCTVESCSVCTECGSGYGCTLFALLNLTSGPIGTRIDSSIQSDNPDACPTQPSIVPGQSVAILLEFSSVVESQIYHVGLAADIVTAHGSMRVSFPSVFNRDVVFASKSQFSCYGLQGNSFRVETLPNKPSCI